MKKIIIFIFCLLLCYSCNKQVNDTKQIKTDTKECLEINGCKYYKIKLGNHDVFQYKFGTYYGIGSDIIHFDDMCKYCSERNGK